MKQMVKQVEKILGIGGMKKDITFLVLSGIAVVCSLFHFNIFPFDAAWAAILLCGVPIIAGAVIGLVTEFDIKADVDDRVEELPHLFGLAKQMMATIRRNLTFSLSLNFLAIVLAITGILDPVVGALVHNAGSVLVIISSALLLKWKKKEEEDSFTPRAGRAPVRRPAAQES